jgi:hypothetical protein
MRFWDDFLGFDPQMGFQPLACERGFGAWVCMMGFYGFDM